MRPFTEFVDLPKDEIIRILGQGLEYSLPVDLVKTDAYYVTLRTELAKKPKRGQPWMEYIQLNSDYQLMRMVYYPENGGSSVYEPVLNQLDIFLELQRLGFLPLGLPAAKRAKPQGQVWYGYGEQWAGQLEKGFHPFYNHATFRTARELYQTHQHYRNQPEDRDYWRYEYIGGRAGAPGVGVVPGTLVELTWDQVLEACRTEQVYTHTTTVTAEGVSYAVAVSPFKP